MKAVIDRIVDGKWAVILAGNDETELSIPVHMLPVEVKEGSIVSIIVENNEIMAVELLEDDTFNQLNLIKEKMNKLQSKNRSNFKLDE